MTLNKSLKKLALVAGLIGLLASGSANAVVILSEDFEGGIPGTWTVTDDAGTGLTWATTGSGSCTGMGGGGDTSVNYTNGSGQAGCASSDEFGPSDFDTSLITSAMDLSGLSDASLSYTANYQNFGGADFLDVDITTDGGATWINLLSWNEDHPAGGLFVVGGEDVTIDLTAYVGSMANLRWHYYDPTATDFDWYAQIDDVLVEGTAAAAVAEPGSLALLGLGLVGVAALRRRRG